MNKDIKKTLRYKNMVAQLTSQPVYKKEAALLKALAGGTQWRIDAALDAIGMREWNDIKTINVFDQAAMFGRLTAIQRMSENEFFKFPKADSYKYENSARPDQIGAAFDTAVIHGHYKVADYCLSMGIMPDHMLGSNRYPRAMHIALQEGDMQKINYLLKNGVSPSLYLASAARTGNQKFVDIFCEKGIDVNHKFVIETLHSSVLRNNAGMVKTLLKSGVKVEQAFIDDAKKHGYQDIADLLIKYQPAKSPANPPPAP